MPSTAPHPEQLQLCSDGRTPNSPHPVLIYRQLPLAGPSPAEAFERLFDSHLWPSAGAERFTTTTITIPPPTKCSAWPAAGRG